MLQHSTLGKIFDSMLAYSYRVLGHYIMCFAVVIGIVWPVWAWAAGGPFDAIEGKTSEIETFFTSYFATFVVVVAIVAYGVVSVIYRRFELVHAGIILIGAIIIGQAVEIADWLLR